MSAVREVAPEAFDRAARLLALADGLASEVVAAGALAEKLALRRAQSELRAAARLALGVVS